MKLYHFISITLLTIMPFILHAEEDKAMPSYQKELEQFQNNFKKFRSELPDDKKTQLDHDLQVLDKAGKSDIAEELPNPGIKVGNKAPDFTLNNPFGKTINLKTELKKGPVVLVFYRGAWCPFCNMHLHVLQESLEEFKKHNAQLIAITPQRPEKSEAQIKKDGYSFEVLSDLTSQVIKDYHLYYELTDELTDVLKKNGYDVVDHNGEGRKELPIPATFVIDSAGVVRAMHAPIDYTQRMEPKDILQALVGITPGK